MTKTKRTTRSAHRAIPEPTIVHDTATCPCSACEVTRTKTRPPELVGYSRVSTDEQKTDTQDEALRAAGCARIFPDVISGMSTSRPELDECMAHLQPGDTLVVVRLDRLGRSLHHLLGVIDDLSKRGVTFRSLGEPFIDTTSPAGGLITAIFGAVAEYERKIMIERVKATMATMKRQGQKVGGPRTKLNAGRIEMAQAAIDSGKPTTAVSRDLKVSRSTLYRARLRSAAEAAAIDQREADALKRAIAKHSG